MIYIKSSDIVNHIFYNRDILTELQSKMRSNSNMHQKHDAIEFFMEVCQMTKNMQLGARYSCFDSNVTGSVIEILAESFSIY